jgi:hypothetical protein
MNSLGFRLLPLRRRPLPPPKKGSNKNIDNINMTQCHHLFGHSFFCGAGWTLAFIAGGGATLGVAFQPVAIGLVVAAGALPNVTTGFATGAGPHSSL